VIKAHRSSVGYEVEPEYFRILKRRFEQVRMGAEVNFFGA
jgi:DNA modification methylase